MNNELILLKERFVELLQVKDGDIFASSLDVANEFGKLHKHVLDSIKSGDFSENFSRTNFRLAHYKDTQDKPRPYFFMTRDGFSFIVMGFTGKKAAMFKEAFIYAFNEMENRLRNSLTLPNFLDPAESAIAWAEQYKARQIAEQKVKELKPKGEVYDAFIENEGYFNFKQVADLFNVPGLGRSKFMAMLRKDGILNQHNEPYRPNIDNDRFKTCLQDGKGTYKNGEFIPRYNTLVSPKGIDFLFKKYKDLILDVEDFKVRKYKLINKL
jgi:Rha family phage regulatory protein